MMLEDVSDLLLIWMPHYGIATLDSFADVLILKVLNCCVRIKRRPGLTGIRSTMGEDKDLSTVHKEGFRAAVIQISSLHATARTFAAWRIIIFYVSVVCTLSFAAVLEKAACAARLICGAATC